MIVPLVTTVKTTDSSHVHLVPTWMPPDPMVWDLYPTLVNLMIRSAWIASKATDAVKSTKKRSVLLVSIVRLAQR